ncbi:MAG TPA: hypothetical protein PKE29_03335 [Phycisphaerales bacterium]|nr:hypothetical protein [Phycisphaerales bacterium]
MSLMHTLAWGATTMLALAQSAAGAPADGSGMIRPPYRPFIDPLEVHGWWWAMLVPMALGIAVVYKAVRVLHEDVPWGKYLREVVAMTLQVVVGMILLVAASYALVEVYARWIAGRQ